MKDYQRDDSDKAPKVKWGGDSQNRGEKSSGDSRDRGEKRSGDSQDRGGKSDRGGDRGDRKDKDKN